MQAIGTIHSLIKGRTVHDVNFTEIHSSDKILFLEKDKK